MATISERKQHFEQAEEENGTLSRRDYRAVSYCWTAFRPAPGINTLYSKHFGTQSALNIDAVIETPQIPARRVNFFAVTLYSSQIGCESYRIFTPRRRQQAFHSCAITYTAQEAGRGDKRPLTEDEINEILNIFKEQLSDFGGEGLAQAIRQKFSPRWNKRFMLASLHNMCERAIRLNDTDWSRYAQIRRA